MYSRTPDIWPDNWTVNTFPRISVHTLTIVWNTSLPPFGSQSLFTTVSACNSLFCACHNWWAWITITADDTWRHRYLRISRHVLNCCVLIIPVFPANIAVILFVKGVFWSSDYPPFLCYNQGLIPWRSDTKGGTIFYLPTKSLKIAGKY